MTANPDSALRQALEKARDALRPFKDNYRGAQWPDDKAVSLGVTVADLRRAREAHALITEALQTGEKT